MQQYQALGGLYFGSVLFAKMKNGHGALAGLIGVKGTSVEKQFLCVDNRWKTFLSGSCPE